MHLPAIKTTATTITSEEERMEVDGFDNPAFREEGAEEAAPQTPSFAVSPSFALLATAGNGGDAAFDNALLPLLPATAEALPSDVLWRLATLLPVQDLPAMMAVCRNWRCGFGAAIDVLAPSSLSSDFDAADFDDGAPSPSASFLPRRFPCLRSLDLSSVPAVTATDRALAEPLARLTGLTRLSLRGCRALTSRGVAQVLGPSSGLPRLRSLDLSGCVGLLLNGGGGEKGCCSRSTGGGGAGGGGFAAALPEGSLAGLEEFSADRIPWLGDGDVEALARALLPSPSSSSSLPPSSSSSSSSSPPRRGGLVKLSLDGAGKLTGKGLAALPFPSKLERLSLAGCAALDDAGLALGLAPFSSSSSSSLAELVLDRCALVTGSGLAGAAPFPRGFPALRRLSARDSGIDDAGIAAAAASAASGSGDGDGEGGEKTRCCGCRFPALEELILDGCSALTDYGVDALAGRTRGAGATGAGAAAAAAAAAAASEIVGGLPSLARLSLARLPRLQGWGLSSLLDSPESHLTSLCLSGCLRLADAAAQAIGGARSSGVEVLDVSDCARVAVGFCAALRGAPLKKLKVSRCPRLSPAAVEALGAGRAAETLEELEASGCTALVADSGSTAGGAGGRGGGGGISAVASALPNLCSLDLSATPLTQRGLGELLFDDDGDEDGAGQRRLRLPSLTALNLACCPRLSRPAVQRLLLSASNAAAGEEGGGRGCRLRVNSWGCKEEEEEDDEKERPSKIVVNDSSSSPVLSFGHLSPQRGNGAAAAALAAAA